MKKIIFWFSFLSLLATTATASDTLYFVGHIKVSKKVSYKYNLRFTISEDNKITGYSLSDPGGPNETKTKIFGTYDSVNKIISFEEKNVLRSKVNLPDLCFVKADLKFKKTKLLEELSGKFTGIDPGKTEPCANGEIKLINTDRYKSIMKQINEPEKPIETEIATKDSDPKDGIIKINSAKGKEFLITGNVVKFTIWDAGEIDGDRISILLNDKYILENYTIGAATKIMEIALSENETDTVKIIALNEGSLPPNSAAIQIETKFEKYPILTQAKLNEVRTIYLRKKTHQ